MSDHQQLEFALLTPFEPFPTAVALTPLVDGRSLVDLVGEYERSHGYQPAGGYAGIMPSFFSHGDLASYFLGTDVDQFPEPGCAALLGCECSDVGCRPLVTRIVVSADTVSWTDFGRPVPREHDYVGFGPYVFLRVDYEYALRKAARLIRSGPV